MTPKEQADKLALEAVVTLDKAAETVGGFETQEQVAEIISTALHLEDLLKDKARLDYLETNYHRVEWLISLNQNARKEIDKSMKHL